MNRTIISTIFLTALVATFAIAQETVNTDANNVAIHGYDPVAYFTREAAVPGDPEITHTQDGAVYRFANEANRDAFAADPESYLPAYGGYCAWAVSQGYTADVDPETWIVHEGRLYLNFNRRIGRRFQSDLVGNIQRADANWPGLSR